MIDYYGNQFTSSNTRPSWTTALKKRVVEQYNRKHDTTYNYRKMNLSDESMDRAHRISFKTIQSWLLDYLEKPIDLTVFCKRTNQLFDPTTAGGVEIESKRDELIELVRQGRTGLKLLPTANSLLRLLNSSVYNVDLGDASLNRSIQEHFDPNFDKVGTQYSASPRTKGMLGALSRDESGGIKLTPGKTRVLSSHAGPVPIGNLTPNTKPLIKKHEPQ